MGIETATDIYGAVQALLNEPPKPGRQKAPHGLSFENGRRQALQQVLHILEDDFGVMAPQRV